MSLIFAEGFFICVHLRDLRERFINIFRPSEVEADIIASIHGSTEFTPVGLAMKYKLKGNLI
jgi:hypothetical protein